MNRCTWKQFQRGLRPAVVKWYTDHIDGIELFGEFMCAVIVALLAFIVVYAFIISLVFLFSPLLVPPHYATLAAITCSIITGLFIYMVTKQIIWIVRTSCEIGGRQ